MEKYSTFPNLLQKVISEEELALVQQAAGYPDTARKLDVFTLVQYLTSAALHSFKSYRHCADVGSRYGLPRVDHSTLSKKAGQMDFRIMKQLFELVLAKCNRLTRRAMKLSRIRDLLLIDSTTITVGQTRLPWALYHGERAGIKLHISYTPATGMPLKVQETTGLVHDGPVGEKLADPRFILVEDRAYFQIKRIDRFAGKGQAFVIRMKENVEIARPHRLKRLEPSDSPVTKDISCLLGTPQSRSGKRHRVVFFKDNEGREIRVVTNLLGETAEAIADMYKARWEIETFFRWIKQNLNVPVLFGTTENAVFNQLFAALITYVLLKWLYSKTGEGRVFTRLSLVSFQRLLMENELPVDWLSEMLAFLKRHTSFQGICLPKLG